MKNFTTIIMSYQFSMNTANSFNLVVCEDLSSYTYYPWLGSYVPQSKSGWQKDAIIDGKLTVAYTDSKLEYIISGQHRKYLFLEFNS